MMLRFYKLFLLTGLLCLGNLSAADEVLDAGVVVPKIVPSEEPVSEKTKAHQVIGQLAGVKLKQVWPILKEIEKMLGAEGLPLFQAIIESRLYYQRVDKKIVIIRKQNNGMYRLFDPVSLEEIGEKKKSSLKKVRSNNRIRKNLRVTISRLRLLSPDVEVRKVSIHNMLGNLDHDTIRLLEKISLDEQHQSVLELIDLALALYYFQNSDQQIVRLSALELMSSSLEPLVRNLINDVLKTDSAGRYIEQDSRVVRKALSIKKAIDAKVRFYEILEKIFFGLSLGSVLLLAAIGLAITFGVMGVINMTHGEMIMLGAYTTYVIQLVLPNYIEYSVLIAIPAAFLVSGLVGIIIQRSVIRFLHGRPLETLLATFGISLILQQTVRSIFSPLNRQVESPQWLSGSMEFNAVFSITYNRLYILIFALIVFFVLQLILKKTSLGLHVRAVSQNRDMAKSMGIRTEWVDALTFGLGSGIAGIAGVALSQLTNVGPNLGQAYIIDSFMVVVFGGVGNLWGTLVGGFTLGLSNKFLEPLTGAVLANILVLVFIILFIQKRPRGLFPQKGRAAE